jgi:drug/metabolite transporter (DMT)-like permease
LQSAGDALKKCSLRELPRLFSMTNITATPAVPASSRYGTEQPFVAIGLVLLALVVFSVMDTLSKLLAAEYDPIEVVCGRYLAMIVVLGPLALRQPKLLRTTHPRLQLARSFCILGSALFFIAGLARLPIADATVIGFASPLLVTAFSIPLLGEKVGIRRWAAVVVGFLGVLIVIRPGTGAIGSAALLPLLSAVCWAMSIVVTRRMRGNDRPVTTLLYSTIIGLFLSGMALPFVWQTPTLHAVSIAFVMGMLSIIGQYLLIAGLTRGDASLIAPFSYSQMIWSTLAGFLVFGAVPTVWTWCGAAVIVGSGIYIAQRERLRSRARS